MFMVILKVNFNNYFFLRDKLLISMKMLVFFLAKCVRNAVKTLVVDRKNQKALALLYLASKPLRKAANSSGPSSNRTDEANLNFSGELYRLIFFA